jgi:hypothetical protein
MYRTNPPHVRRIPKTLEYLRIYVLEMAYVNLPKQCESPRAFRQRVYRTLHTIGMAGNRLRDMHIKLLHPTIDWARVWTNLRGT